MTDKTPPGYNIFAAVLAEMIAGSPLDTPGTPPRGARLEQLTRLGAVDDFRGIDDRLRPETVHRLKRSLSVAGQFPVLNKDNIDKVARTFKLSSNEKRRLRAALLATSIEAKLAPRIGFDRALQAARSLLPVIEEGMKQLESDESSGIAWIRKRDEGANMTDETELERRFGRALAAIDRGMLALGILQRVESQIEQVDGARQARDQFASALSILQQADEDLQDTSDWQFWYQEAQKGLSEAEQILKRYHAS